MADAEYIYLPNLLPQSRDRFPNYRIFMDEADRSVAVAQRKITDWRREFIDPVLPIERKPLSLHIRCAIFAVLVTQRAVSLAEGLAREIEAVALFPAGAVARAQLELVGLTSGARKTIPSAARKLPDVEPLHVETFRYLFGARTIGAGTLPRHFEIGQLLEAAKEQLGKHVGDDYALLCDLAHPNGIVAWSMLGAVDMLDFDPAGISDSVAELLLKVCGQGTACIVRNCNRLLEWAATNHVPLPFVEPDGLD